MTYTKDTLLEFGKFKGTPLKDVPPSHLLYLEMTLRRNDWRDLQAYIRLHADELKEGKPLSS